MVAPATWIRSRFLRLGLRLFTSVEFRLYQALGGQPRSIPLKKKSKSEYIINTYVHVRLRQAGKNVRQDDTFYRYLACGVQAFRLRKKKVITALMGPKLYHYEVGDFTATLGRIPRAQS